MSKTAGYVRASTLIPARLREDLKAVHVSPNSWAIIRSVSSNIHTALWALLISGTVWLLLHLPQMRDARARAEAQRVQEVSEENKLYCQKWGMPARSHEHVICTMDLDHIRKDVEQRIANDTSW
jgi:hypothetical protein